MSRFQSWLHWCTLPSFIFQPKVDTRAQGYCSARARFRMRTQSHAWPLQQTPSANSPVLWSRCCSKEKNGSWKLITHLTSPRRLSINDGIDLEKYKQFDNAICLHETDRTWLLHGKHGLKTHAFRLRSVCREDWDLLRVY